LTYIPPYAPSQQEFQRQVSSQLNAFFQRLSNLPNYANDTAAAAGGVKVGELYRNGSQVCVRVA
jgi:hypothetical protein